jgi:steroid delta-isomerase
VIDSSEFRRALEHFFECWNKRDRAAWLSCLAEDARHEEPVGAEPRIGHAPFAEMYDFVDQSYDETFLDIKQLMVCGNEAAVYFVATSMIAGMAKVTQVIEIWEIDEQGKLCGVRAFVDPQSLVNTPAAVRAGVAGRTV